MIERRISDIDFAYLTLNRKYFASPDAWEDQVLYFLLLDRFSNGKEKNYKGIDGDLVTKGDVEPYNKDVHAINSQENADWVESGEKWCGGTLKGLMSKIGYLKRLGVSAIWISPIFKQVSYCDSYHGYGIQNFLDVDPNFGCREDVVELVKVAHENGIYVILDVILNHVGDIYKYDVLQIRDAAIDGDTPLWNGRMFPAAGFRNKSGDAVIPFEKNENPDLVHIEDSVWPLEFQNPLFYSRKGRINNWDYYPEYLEGDFFGLKDINLGVGEVDTYVPSPALLALCEAYKYWIAIADIDGFRVDTVKHMDKGATRYFTSAIHEFAQKIGKDNFYLLGEITGGRYRAFVTLEETGIDAALGIDDIQDKLEKTVKGYVNPSEYFNLFRNSIWIGKDSQKWFRDKIITMIDDHDKVVENSKTRFCAQSLDNRKYLLNGIAMNLTTIGIPCIYYGTEQGFDGEGNDVRFIREAMFGGKFGAFRSRNGHFFNEETYEYVEMGKIIRIIRENITIRRGRQYLREISGNGVDFGQPESFDGAKIESIIAWSRILDNEEIILAVNTSLTNTLTCFVTLDSALNKEGQDLRYIYPVERDEETKVLKVKNDRHCVSISVPPHGFVILQKNGGIK